MAKDITGMKFGRLTVVRLVGRQGKHIFWECVCDCGGKKDVAAYRITSGVTKSCGCIRREMMKKRGANLNRSHLKKLPPDAYIIPRGKRKAKYLSDSYIKEILTYDVNLSSTQIPDWLIIKKREQIKFMRELRKLTKTLKEMTI